MGFEIGAAIELANKLFDSAKKFIGGIKSNALEKENQKIVEVITSNPQTDEEVDEENRKTNDAILNLK